MELLKEKVQKDDFLTVQGLGNEVPFWIFDYLPEKELLVRRIIDRIASNDNIQLMFLTGVGKVWPLVRSHSILNNLQPVTGNVPLVAFYPGGYDNHAYKY